MHVCCGLAVDGRRGYLPWNDIKQCKSYLKFIGNNADEIFNVCQELWSRNV